MWAGAEPMLKSVRSLPEHGAVGLRIRGPWVTRPQQQAGEDTCRRAQELLPQKVLGNTWTLLAAARTTLLGCRGAVPVLLGVVCPTTVK